MDGSTAGATRSPGLNKETAMSKIKCSTGKDGYSSAGQARRAKAQTKGYVQPLRVYRCPVCRFYHVTRKNALQRDAG
jgi:hypothetical protein